MKLEQVIIRDVRASQPLATSVAIGTLFCVTDESNIVERSNGTIWQAYSPSAAVSGITQLTGDVTAGPGSGSQVATIAALAVSTGKVANSAITYAKIQNLATDRLLGRDTAASGVAEELTVTSGIEFTGSVGIQVTPNVRYRTIKFIFDGGSTTPTVGSGLPIGVDFTGVIVEAHIFGQNAAGSAVVDIWKTTYAGAPPVLANTIVAAAPPTLTATNKNKDTTLTGWTIAITAGDVLKANLNSVSLHTWVTVELKVLVS